MTVVSIRRAGFGPQNSAHLPGLGHKSNIEAGEDYAIALDADTGLMRVTLLKAKRTLVVPQGVWLWCEPAEPAPQAAPAKK